MIFNYNKHWMIRSC